MADDTPTGEKADPRAAVNMDAEEFRTAGHRLVDELAKFYASFPDRPVACGESADQIREVLPRCPLPDAGRPATELIAEVTRLLLDHSTHNGHPRFFGYITASAAPLGVLAELLAAGINQNCGLRDLSPAANEIEMQAVGWLAELIGFPTPCGGLMVSGGNMANIVAFVAARHACLPGDIRRAGLHGLKSRPRIYASSETHTWIQKATDISGLGTDAIHWIPVGADRRLEADALSRAIEADKKAGETPFLVVGTAGNVSTGAVDPLDSIAAIARDHQLWFHVDGAYGAPAAALPEAPPALQAIAEADSVALDPHKWLYNPIEAACTLVRDTQALRNAFSFRPSYYRLARSGLDYYEHGFQNTRAFRALKVWLCLRQAGRRGYVRSIREDIALSRYLGELVQSAPELECGSQQLSICTFRYRPENATDTAQWTAYLDKLNDRLLVALQEGGEVYVSNAVLDGRRFLRTCIVNFRTRKADIDALVATATRLGRKLDAELRPDELTS